MIDVTDIKQKTMAQSLPIDVLIAKLREETATSIESAEPTVVIDSALNCLTTALVWIGVNADDMDARNVATIALRVMEHKR